MALRYVLQFQIRNIFQKDPVPRFLQLRITVPYGITVCFAVSDPEHFSEGSGSWIPSVKNYRTVRHYGMLRSSGSVPCIFQEDSIPLLYGITVCFAVPDP